MATRGASEVAQQLSQLHLDPVRQPADPPAAAIAGTAPAVAALREIIGWPQLYAEQGRELGVTWPRGLLLHGPPGTGKTLAVRAVASEFGATLHTVTASSVFGAYTGESERRLREAFEKAAEPGEGGGQDGRGSSPPPPAVLFLDELDALCPRRDAKRPHESRVVAQLLTLLDGASAADRRLVVVGATNRPNAIDPALRRPGRLDREVAVPIPDAADRAAILALHARSMPLDEGVDLAQMAADCRGFTGADLAALCREAAMHALSAADAAGESGGTVGLADWAAARARVKPSITRGTFTDVSPVAWDDIGGLDDVKQRLKHAVEWPLRHKAAFERLNLSPPRGVLLHGPPGCCKTTLVRAAATASGAHVVALAGASLFSMYVGEGEALLRSAFQRARQAAPSIVFLDELDALVGSRDGGDGGQSGAAARLLSTLLTEMDGLELATGVLVLAATNRPSAVDAALLRPGRFDMLLYVPPPDAEGRLQTLGVHTRRMPLGPDVDLAAVAAATDLYTGAELERLCHEAAHAALREDMDEASQVCMRHFQRALDCSSPYLTRVLLESYASWGSRSGDAGPGSGSSAASK